MKKINACIAVGISVLIGAATFSPAHAEGILKICKVAGPGVAVGTPFHFLAGSNPVTVPAGPAPGGTCVVGPTLQSGPVAVVVQQGLCNLISMSSTVTAAGDVSAQTIAFITNRPHIPVDATRASEADPNRLSQSGGGK